MFTNQIRSLQVAALMFASLALASPAAATLVDAFNGAPSGGDLRNDPYPQAGYGFYTTATGGKQVNELGFWVAPQVTGAPGVLAASHEVGLYDYNGNNYTLLASATVPAGSVADANGYAWASIPTITLTDTRQGADYYIVEASQGVDTWTPNFGSITHPVLDPSFGTLTGNGPIASTPFPAVGGTTSVVFQLGNGGYVGGNIGFLATPEPASLALALVGALGLALVAARRR